MLYTETINNAFAFVAIEHCCIHYNDGSKTVGCFLYVICTQDSDSGGRVVWPGTMDALFVVSFLMSHDTADTFSTPSY